MLVASSPRRRRAPRLDESIVQGVPRRSVRYTVVLYCDLGLGWLHAGLCNAFVDENEVLMMNIQYRLYS